MPRQLTADDLYQLVLDIFLETGMPVRPEEMAKQWGCSVSTIHRAIASQPGGDVPKIRNVSHRDNRYRFVPTTNALRDELRQAIRAADRNEIN